MDLFRYLTLAGVLYCLGVYGVLTRRSVAGILISLGVTVSAVALTAMVFNRFVRPAEADGYFLGAAILIIGAIYLSISALTARASSDSESVFTSLGSIAHPESLPFQVSITMVFIVGYVLSRISLPGLAAFIFGALALKYLLYEREKKSRPSAPSKLERIDLQEFVDTPQDTFSSASGGIFNQDKQG